MDIDALIDLLQDLKDDDPCELDHHGNCQSHGWVRGKDDCPQRRIEQLLNELKEIPRKL